MKSTTKKAGRMFAIAAVILLCVLAPANAAKKDPLAQFETATGTAYPAGKQFSKPIDWAPGQYVITGVRAKGKLTSVSKMLLVRKEAGGWVIETVETDKKGKETVSQILMLGYDEAFKTNDTSKFKLGWMKTRDEDGKIQTIEGEQLAMFNMIVKSTWDKLLVNIGSFTDGGSVTVPAGVFAATNFQKASVKVLGMNIETESWYHAAVPVNGVVKTQTADGKNVTELLSFGFDGKPVLE